MAMSDTTGEVAFGDARDARAVVLASATVVCCAIGVALAGPEWLPRRWTQEDGPIEWVSFAGFLLAGGLALVAATHLRPTPRSALAAAALGLVLLVAAGEEISWGQRIFELDTPAVLVDGNRQDELNLHNVDGLQQRAVLAQLLVAGAGVAVALRVRRPWARVGAPLFAGYLAYRATRGVSAVVDWGPAGRNAEAAELFLALGLLALTVALVAEVRQVQQARRAA
jgi:hypothetical protein